MGRKKHELEKRRRRQWRKNISTLGETEMEGGIEEERMRMIGGS